MLVPDLAIVGAARRAGTDSEGLTTEGAIGRGHQDLRPNVFLVLEVHPRQFPKTAAWACVGIGCRECDGRDTDKDRHKSQHKQFSHHRYTSL